MQKLTNFTVSKNDITKFLWGRKLFGRGGDRPYRPHRPHGVGAYGSSLLQGVFFLYLLHAKVGLHGNTVTLLNALYLSKFFKRISTYFILI